MEQKRPKFEKPDEAKPKQPVDPMTAYFQYHTLRHAEKRREAEQSRGIYEDIKRKYRDE